MLQYHRPDLSGPIQNASILCLRPYAFAGIGVTILPTGLLHARNLTRVGHRPETNATDLELTIDRSAPAADLATRIASAPELRRLSRFVFQCLSRHQLPPKVLHFQPVLSGNGNCPAAGVSTQPYASLKGIPNKRRSSLPSSFDSAVVTNVIFMPC